MISASFTVLPGIHVEYMQHAVPWAKDQTHFYQCLLSLYFFEEKRQHAFKYAIDKQGRNKFTRGTLPNLNFRN
jgi:hypothetical protein